MAASKDILENKVAIVTGAGRGIGRATALRLASEGARVALAARTVSELKETEELIRHQTQDANRAFSFEADLSEESSIIKLFETTAARLGSLDILINNAGTFTNAAIVEHEVDDWDYVMAVNLRAPFICSREAFRKMKAGSCIVNVSSLAGVRGTEKFRGLSAYVASKFGIIGLTESLALEGLERGIRVNCIAPGAVDTVMLKQAAPHLKTQTSPEDIAGIILSLCDPERSRALNGAVIEVFSNLGDTGSP